MDGNPLVGTWRLVSWVSRDADGQVSHPFGRDPLGYLIYTADGYMSAILTPIDRLPFAAGDILRGTGEEQARAAATCIAYAGRYEVQAGRVVHNVETSLFPNWVGGAQERRFEFDGDRLSLSTAPLLQDGRERRALLVCERVGGGDWLRPAPRGA
jgi:Lipocalin-like domain